MKKAEIVKKLISIFRNTFDNNSIEISDGLSADDIEEWNSLSHMLLIVEIEKEFAIKFKLKDLNKMHNVGYMINLIESKLLD